MKNTKFYLSEDAHKISSSGRKYSLKRFRRGFAIEFIESLDAVKSELEDKPLCLYCRVSTEQQKRNGNLDQQVDHALTKLDALGLNPFKVIAVVESGNIFKRRFGLEAGIEFCRENGAILVVYSRDRLIRSRLYNGSKYMEWPVVGEYRLLKAMLSGVQTATIYEPDDGEVRNEHIKRGHRNKGKPGRPINLDQCTGYRARRKRAYFPLARRLKASGRSYREIANVLNSKDDNYLPISHMGICGWFR